MTTRVTDPERGIPSTSRITIIIVAATIFATMAAITVVGLQSRTRRHAGTETASAVAPYLPQSFEVIRPLNNETAYVRDRNSTLCFLVTRFRGPARLDYTALPTCPSSSEQAGGAP